MGLAALIDADAHIVETRQDLESFGWAGTGHEICDGMIDHLPTDPLLVKNAVNPRTLPGAFDPAARLVDMDAEGIDVAIVFPSALLCIADAPDLARANDACRVYNDWFVGTYGRSGRVRAMAAVNVADVAAAVIETRRAVTELGMVGVTVPPYTPDRHLDDPAFDPLWATVQELGVPIGIHGGRSIHGPHLNAAGFGSQARFYAMVHPFHQMYAMADLTLGGVLERFPDLKVVFLEAGIGWMPSYIERLDKALVSFTPDTGGDSLPRPPSEYLLSGRCWFSCEADEHGLPAAIDALGEDHVVVASDYPHFDCEFPATKENLVHASGLSDRVITKVGCDNPTRLYGL
jgi:predicted TIM-barrel fold metal-dependent hydrolase